MTEKRILRFGAEIPPIAVLYADGHLLAIDKPSGLLSVRDRWDAKRPNVADLLQHGVQNGDAWAKELNLSYVANAHRLDADTSGILLFACTRETLSRLADQFRRRAMGKEYLAVVRGALPNPEVVVEARISPDARRPGRAFISKQGAESLTRFTEIDRFRGYSVVAAFPETGRMHQIRVHLNSINCPIVADPFYGGAGPLLLSEIKRKYKPAGEERPLLGRLALHARKLAVDHPVDGRRVEIESPIPDDFEIAIKYLKKFAG